MEGKPLLIFEFVEMSKTYIQIPKRIIHLSLSFFTTAAFLNINMSSTTHIATRLIFTCASKCHVNIVSKAAVHRGNGNRRILSSSIPGKYVSREESTIFTLKRRTEYNHGNALPITRNKIALPAYNELHFHPFSKLLTVQRKTASNNIPPKSTDIGCVPNKRIKTSPIPLQ